jgi:hypothetical protein
VSFFAAQRVGFRNFVMMFCIVMSEGCCFNLLCFAVAVGCVLVLRGEAVAVLIDVACAMTLPCYQVTD